MLYPTTPTGFLPAYLTTEEVFLSCGIQWRRFSSFVGYNGKGFVPLWDTMEKNDTMQKDIF
jgi:hypothetical protein